MVLFDTTPHTITKKTLTLWHNSHLMIADLRYSLAGKEQHNAIGVTDFKESKDLLIDTNGCTILLVTAGYAIAEINFRYYSLSYGDVVFLFYDDVFTLSKCSTRFSVQFVSISYESVNNVFYTITSVPFWDFLYENPVLRTNEKQRLLLNGWWNQMEWIVKSEKSPYINELLHNNMLNLFMAVHTEIIRRGIEPSNLSRNQTWLLTMKFWKMIVKHCREHRDVQFYATRLCITTTYLYKLTQKVMHASPKELIDQQIISQIKTFLMNTDYSVGQIATEFHFEDASYFCRFFRRMTGLSPIEFRNGNKGDMKS